MRAAGFAIQLCPHSLLLITFLLLTFLVPFRVLLAFERQNPFVPHGDRRVDYRCHLHSFMIAMLVK